MKVTQEMRQAVREDECRSRGRHSWTVIETYGGGPIKVICDNCGADSGLVRKDRTANGGHASD